MKRALLVLVFLAACGGQRASIPAIDDLERARAGNQAKEAQRLAPQAFAEAEQLRGEAIKARDDGDDVGAALRAERAIAAYERAMVLARLARATTDQAGAQTDLARTETELHSLAATRAEVTRDGDELEKKIKIAQELHAPPPAGPADASREAARLVAARSLAVQARLLCGAAHLVVPSLTGLKEAEDAAAALEKKLEGTPKPAPIDDAGARRVACLDLLTKARRTTEGQTTTDADALLSELSSASWSPTRDERGVVVTLRDVFAGSQVNVTVEPKLKDLGRIAAAHSGLGVQVVVHDSFELKGGAERAAAIQKLLIAGGASADKVSAEAAGTKNPVVDPSDAKNRARNARVEIVFVTK
jgi:flagellar motor protein MotB